jgi:uncharacterized surface protein with fasciclin (FAS1) repeats
MKSLMSILGVGALLLGGELGGVMAQTGTLIDLGSLLSGQKNLTTFYGLIQKYPQILLQLPSYQGVTILAPNDDAFNKIPYTSLNDAFKNNDADIITNVIEYHILQGTRLAASLVPGSPVFIPTLLTNTSYSNVTNGQRVENVEQAGDVVVFVSGEGNRCTLVQSDLMFTGGVVQIIDSLLIPPANLTSTTQSFNLTSFEGSLYSAQLSQNLTYTPNVTIFAPANSAFQALGPAISSMTSQQLATILDYHVLSNEVVYSPDLTNGSHFPTLQGGNITVMHVGNNVYINSAQLLTSDILIANGVLHVIDNVLNWASPNQQPNPNIPTQNAVFPSASVVTNLPFTSALPCTTSCSVSSSSSSRSGVSTAVTKGGATTSTAGSGSFTTSSSKAGAMAARETGFVGVGVMGLVGAAAMMI